MDFFYTLKFKIITILLNIILVIILIITLIPKDQKQEIIHEEINNIEEIHEEETNITKIYSIDIKGAVNNPGVYEISSDSNINDAITLAGGLKSGGTTKNINLSKKVSDQMVIYIYTTKELTTTSISTEPCKTETITIDNCTNNKESIIVSNDTKTETVTNNNSNISNKININTATKEELLTLNGIGESKANSIIEYRTNNKFVKIEDIKQVNGISDSIFEKIKDNITT